MKTEALQVDGTGWLNAARRVASPHANERPGDGRITLVVLHGVSLPPGEFGGPWVEDFFAGRLNFAAHPYFGEIRDLRVAPHLLIRRDGDVVQFVSFLRRAWHAGRSCWHGRAECNDYSIGIELEGTDTTPYAGEQYRKLDAVLSALIETYPGIREGGIVAHSDVAPQRKTDPGPAFDWPRMQAALTTSGYNLPARSDTETGGRKA